MSDLYIDYEMLVKTQKDIEDIHEVMAAPCREMEDVDGASMGVYKLAQRMDDFGDEWSYGIKQMSKFSKSAAKALGQIKKTFEETDEQFARELEKARSPKGGKK
ncbi:hypothetical protein GA0115233_100381 [Streptomyces sp. DI166]|uniref:hypothetical protein n=1 Tax=unclassified Streptomyces TaxID=2593676 RepID=UPI0007F3413A|nr:MULTISPECIES: hypothetical protein [unclassified Streptomyces]SBT88559.1 hypothetical protein GA0115233_100381 [Streptomyces sp. DI166]